MASTDPLTILLVDDEVEILATLARGLQRGLPEVRVLTAASGQEGIDVIASTKVDLIISDHRMPGMLGVDFLLRAKEISPRASRLMMSGFFDVETLGRDVNEAKVLHVFSKPFRLADVLSVVREVIDGRRLELEERLSVARAFAAAHAERTGGSP